MWATFEDGDFHKSVHLQQFRPELFEGKSEKELKKKSISFYQYFKPDFIYDELRSFLGFNFNNTAEFDQSVLIRPKNKSIRQPFTAIVITKNEAENLSSLIRNLTFADEVIVVDSFSDDGSLVILKTHPEVKVVQRKFINYSDQRNFAIKQAKHNWVLFIDADERIPKSLQYEINSALSSESTYSAYELYRQFYFNETPLRYGGFQTDKVIRLFDKRSAHYDSKKLVHETLNVQGTVGALKSKLLHFSFKDIETYKEKLISYAKLRAKELNTKSISPTIFHMHIKPLYRFVYHYLIRRGFLDGKAGYLMAKLNAFGVKQRFVELKKLRANQQ